MTFARTQLSRADERLFSMRRRVPVALIALLAMACAGPPAPSPETLEPTIVSDASPVAPTATASPVVDVFLPTYPPWDILPLGQIGGRLVEDNGCLWIENTGRSLAIWPSGSRIERDGTSLVVVNTRGARAVVGTEVIGGGGEFGQENYAFVVETIGEEIPDECRGDDEYLIVYDVRPVDE